MTSISTCTQVTEDCPVAATPYGYVPNFPGNTTIDVVFGIAMTANIIFTVMILLSASKRRQHWALSVLVLIGTILEFVGYLARIWMGFDVWNTDAVGVQLVCLVLGPALLVAALHLVFSDPIHAHGEQYSRIPVRHFKLALVTCDFASILIQAVGCGLTAAQRSLALGTTGEHIILAGVVIQLATMLGVCYSFTRYVYWYRRTSNSNIHNRITGEGNDEMEQAGSRFAKKKTVDTKAAAHGVSVIALTGMAYTLVFIRNIYRIYEFAGGWGGLAMRHEAPFLVLDGAVMAIAAALVTFVHSTFLFPKVDQGVA